MAAIEDINDKNIEKALSEQKETEMALHIFSERLNGKRKSVYMMEQLQHVEQKLKEKEEECSHLSKEQCQSDSEIQELTAAIFEEANKMIQEATLKRMSAERKVKETEGEIEVLQEEVAALKKIIQNHSPLPQPSTALSFLSPSSSIPYKGFIKGHRRANSHCISINNIDLSPIMKPSITVDSDAGRTELFIEWKSKPTLDQSNVFISDIIKWDISPCLEFPNQKLSREIFQAIMQNQLFVEPLNKLAFENYCHLCNRSTNCHYKVSFQEHQTDVTSISTFARNRVISVCSLVSYLRYITLGMVKLADDQMYAEILKLLRRMSLARLGFTE